jgi:DNA processing protein
MRALLERFGSAEAVFDATPEHLMEIKGIGKVIAKAIAATDLTRTDSAIARWEAQGVRVLDWAQAEYPDRLRGLTDAPPTLFVRGAALTLRRPVALVGTRQPTRESALLTEQMATTLASAGRSVISGMALGIDTRAHTGALQIPDAITHAVLGCGVLKPYPPQNLRLAEYIQTRGTLISELSPDAGVSAAGLIARNRIISGLCEAVVVMQSNADGGAMYAARAAIRQGCALYVIDDPQNDPQAQSAIDVLREMGAIPLSVAEALAWSAG